MIKTSSELEVFLFLSLDTFICVAMFMQYFKH